MGALNTYRFGPRDGPGVLAIHGITGHGRRWEALATQHLPEVSLIAPDLIGHGRSPWTPPWGIEAQVEGLAAVVREHAAGPVVVVGHSYGGALALHLAASHPELVRALLLLDPAIALPPQALLAVAEDTVEFADYTDRAEAREDKRSGAWGDVAPEVLDAEITEHLIDLKGGRVGWRMSVPAVVATWGELAREFVLPPVGRPTVLVQAMKVQPPYVRPEFRTALAARLGANLELIELDCDHMVPQARPDVVATQIRQLLGV